jgi:hypothetical protein
VELAPAHPLQHVHWPALQHVRQLTVGGMVAPSQGYGLPRGACAAATQIPLERLPHLQALKVDCGLLPAATPFARALHTPSSHTLPAAVTLVARELGSNVTPWLAAGCTSLTLISPSIASSVLSAIGRATSDISRATPNDRTPPTGQAPSSRRLVECTVELAAITTVVAFVGDVVSAPFPRDLAVFLCVCLCVFVRV